MTQVSVIISILMIIILLNINFCITESSSLNKYKIKSLSKASDVGVVSNLIELDNRKELLSLPSLSDILSSINNIPGDITNTENNIRTAISNADNDIKNTINSIDSDIKNTIKVYTNDAKTIFNGMISNMEGIQRLISGALTEYNNNVINCNFNMSIITYILNKSPIQLYKSNLCQLQWVLNFSKFQPFVSYINGLLKSGSNYPSFVEMKSWPTATINDGSNWDQTCKATGMIAELFQIISDDLLYVLSCVDAELNIATEGTMTAVQIVITAVAGSLRTIGGGLKMMCIAVGINQQ